MAEVPVIEELGRRLTRPAEGLTAGVSLGVMRGSDGVFTIVACDAEREVRLDGTDLADADDYDDFASAAMEELREQGMVRGNEEGDASARDEFASDLKSIAVSIAKKSADQSVLFAGRVLHIPAGTSGFERRAAFERFLASGRGRVLAQACLMGSGVLVASRPPAGMEPVSSQSLSVFIDGSWSDEKLGGEVGPLGAARTLRTWKEFGFVSTSACHLRLNSPDGSTPPVGGSVGADADHTKLLAVAEACERYTGGVIDPTRIRSATFDELAGEALDPRLFVSYMDWQYETFDEFQPFVSDQPRLWVDAEDAIGNQRLVLADLVFYPFGWAQHRRHTSTSSSGMAAHTDAQLARAGAMNELVERDAFMRLWLGRNRGRQLVGWKRSAPERLIDVLTNDGWQLNLLQIGEVRTQPILLAVGKRDNALALGASAASPNVAVEKALSELWAASTHDTDIDDAPQTRSEVSRPLDHMLFALSGQLKDPPVFVSETSGTVEFEELDASPGWPDDAVFHEWDFRLTRPFHVVRALSPSLIPMSFGYGQEPYGLDSVQHLMGNSLPRSLDACPAPHPFP